MNLKHFCNRDIKCNGNNVIEIYSPKHTESQRVDNQCGRREPYFARPLSLLFCTDTIIFHCMQDPTFPLGGNKVSTISTDPIVT